MRSIKFRVVENNFSGHFFAAERGEFVKIIYGDYFGGDSFRRSCGTIAQRGENNFLRSVRSLAGECG